MRRTIRRLKKLKKRCEAEGGHILIRNKILGKKLKGKIVVACVKKDDVLFAKFISTEETKTKNNKKTEKKEPKKDVLSPKINKIKK